MKRFAFAALIAIGLLPGQLFAQQVTISINGLGVKKAISPYIYGKNNSISGKNDPLTAPEWQRLRDMGIQMFRENGGNNATKYNWRRKLSSHPDWYNNVYANDWDYAAGTLGTNIPSAQGMWAFQLIGKAAKTGTANFNDWDYNHSQWWSGCSQNLAGGGVINPDGGGDALTDGNPDLYLEDWNADSTTGILDHWFGAGGIGLDPDKIRYWSMDNEPEIWNGTHDDVYPDQPTAEEFMQQYFAVAKKARQRFPGIKLVGPVPANEWQWYNWDGGKISYNGKEYVWLEYFILRVAEEQQASGVRLLDVLDIHFYPGETNASDITQLHRVFFDTTYNYPGANGVKRSGTGGWDNSLTKEYIFKRCNDWLTKYIGPDHGVTFSLTETSLANRTNPNLNASWYASTIGEFAKQGVEIFTPWDWATGMAEVVHLFSHYAKKYIVPAVSSEEMHVSAYPTVNSNYDSMTVMLVNRHLTESRVITLKINDFNIKDGTYKLYSLSGLPASETFVSHATNALQQTNITISQNNITITLPPLSVSALVIPKSTTVYNSFGELLTTVEAENGTLTGVATATSIGGYSGNGYVTGFDATGDKITVNATVPAKDVYRIVIRYAEPSASRQKISINNYYSASLDFQASDEFTSQDAGGFVLNAGANSISLNWSAGSLEIDRVEIYRMEKNTYRIAPELIDTAATDETRNIYDFLQHQFGKRLISGQTHDYYTQIKTLTGKSPMIRDGDFQHFTQGYSYLWVDGGHSFGYDSGDQTVNSLINWYNSTGKKGIVAIQWHWHAPTGDSSSTAGTNTFYTEKTTFDIRQAIIPGTYEYDCVIRDIDSIAFQLKKFQRAGIPVLWRPLHEAGGAWFWWGAKGAQPCLALWDLLIERLKNYHQLHNLIWVWSTPEPDWYPGNDKVDIIGFDSYPGDYNYTSQKATFDNLYTITRGEKLITMSENGPIPDPDACFAEDAPWLYFTSWSNLVVEQNSEAHIQDVFDNPLVLTVESTNAATGFDWRSSLYPEDWRPGFKDSEGRGLQDFSYAGYHMGEKDIPLVTSNTLDVTQPPYNADNTGNTDATSAIQQALDDAGQAGGGVVYLPAGTYKISAAEPLSYALKISYDSTILRGAGAGLTFLKNTSTNMRLKDIVLVSGNYAGWFAPQGSSTAIIFDLIEPTRVIPVESVTGFSIGDQVILTSTPTAEFIAEHKMTGYWTASDIKGVAFMRTILSVDAKNNLLLVDEPTRYALKTRDMARVYHVKKHVSECGIENLSIGNIQNSNSGWDEESYTQASTGAYEVHDSHAIQFKYAFNSWLKNVSTFRPSENTGDYHLLSNGLKINQCRFITIDSCNFEKSQYEGGGGNGYMYTIEANDCLIKNSRANHGRHNYDFKYPYSNGNVILHCRGENSKYASDFHMFLSMSNLFDACAFNADFIESAFRPYGGTSLHGYTSSQSVFYNTTGEACHPDKNYVIDSRQFGMGYIIGTSGPCSDVIIDPAEGVTNGVPYNSNPRDFTEGIGTGEYLNPSSLYLDQLERRKNDSVSISGYQVKIVIRDAVSNAVIPGSAVQIYNDTLVTDATGSAIFMNVPEFFLVNVSKSFSTPVTNRQYMIFSDTTLTLYLTRAQYAVTIKLIRAVTYTPITTTSVIFAGASQVTNSSGEAMFSVYGGSQNYSVTKTSYQQALGTFYVQSDTTLVITLLQTHATMRIRLRTGSTPIDQAQVIANADTLISNSLGDAVFSQLPVSMEYLYLVKKNGYETKSGTVYLTRDTIVLVPMTLGVSVSEIPEAGEIKYWPNPACNILNVTLPESLRNATLTITDLRGIEWYHQKNNGTSVLLSVNNFASGTYLLQIRLEDSTIVRYFVKD
jgi:hypothetical protein